jgi:hypothetical protein
MKQQGNNSHSKVNSKINNLNNSEEEEISNNKLKKNTKNDQ